MVYLTILVRAMYKARIKYHKVVRYKNIYKCKNSEKYMTKDIENIRKAATTDIKEKINENPKFLLGG